MNLTRICRLLKVVALLQAGREHNVDSIARSCGVHRRTIFRDFDVLREAGVPLVYNDQRQRYSLSETFYLPPTSFTPEEALSLIVLCYEFGDRSQLPFFGPARSAVLKLEGLLPPRLREQLRQVSDAISIHIGPKSDLDGLDPTYQDLLRAIGDRRAVRVRYGSLAEGQEISTKLSPYRLLFSRRSWYVIGRSSLHRSVRTFNVGRIRALEMVDDHYEIPRSFSLERYLGNAWHLVPEPGPDHRVVIRFQPRVAKNVAEVRWHATQQTAFLSDGSLDYTVTVSGLDEISWWILGYGDQAEVLEPDELRQKIAAHVARMSRCYAPPPPSPPTNVVVE
jgi:proteasome accessory factor B